MSSLLKFLNKFHLYYLGIMPTVATVFLMQKNTWTESFFILLFFLGTAVVGVYLAMASSYTHPIKNLPLLLWTILDGPIFGFFSAQNINHYENAFINTFLIENFAIWFSIAILAIISGRATKGQMFSSVILAGIILTGLILLLQKINFLEQSLFAYGIILLGSLETFAMKFKILSQDEIVVSDDESIGFIVGFISLWVLSLFVTMGIMAN